MARHDHYQSLARWYDLTVTRPLVPAYARILDLCAARGCSRVLDFGCGTGRLACLLRERGLHVVGLDSSQAMLDRIPGTIRRTKGILFAQGGVPLPFVSSSFDATIISLVLHESDLEPEVLLAEALRVAPRCLVLEWRMPERNLDLPAHILVHAIERAAGIRHYRRFRAFAAGGYLRGAVYRAGVRVVAEERLLAGTLVLAEVMA